LIFSYEPFRADMDMLVLGQLMGWVGLGSKRHALVFPKTSTINMGWVKLGWGGLD